MSRTFSRLAFGFVFIGLYFFVLPFTPRAIDIFAGNGYIIAGFFLYMIGTVLTAISVIKKERGVMNFVNIIGVLIGIFFIGLLSMTTGV